MAEARPHIVDITPYDLIGEVELDIKTIIDTHVDLNRMEPIICSVYHSKFELFLQVTLKHSAITDMIEANLEVLSGGTDNLRFKIKYGFRPFLPYRSHAQIFICTPTRRRSDNYSICTFSQLATFMVANELRLKNDPVDFMANITISLRDPRTLTSKYQVPTVNGFDCDHTLICQGIKMKIHKNILMGASNWFLRRFTDYPMLCVTILDNLENREQRIEKEVLLCLLRFMYGLNISTHNLRTTSLLSAARAFEVNKLFEICEDSMIKQLSPDMAPELFYIGKTEKAHRLMFEAAKYINEKYLDVKARYEWDAIMRAFPQFFADIKPNPRKYFREIIFSKVYSRSTGDLNVRTGASILLRRSEIVRTHPLTGVAKDEKKSEKKEGDTETTTVDEHRGSEDASMFEIESLELDLEPRPRKRASPVVSRRRSDSSSSLRSDSSTIDPFRSMALQDTLQIPIFSRELLKQKLLANEQLEQNVGPTGPARVLFRSLSLPGEDRQRSEPTVQDRSYKSTNDWHKLKFDKQSFDIPMDCRDDSQMGGSKDSTEGSSNSPCSMGAGTLSGERSDLPSPSLPRMRSLEFGLTYSYSSDSVFEHRETPKSMSKVPTPPQDMSVSEISSRLQDISVSPQLMQRIDFAKYTHPEARSLSDISSIPLDSSTSVEPNSSSQSLQPDSSSSSLQTDSNSSSKSRKRRDRRMKVEKTRKLPPGAVPFDFSSTERSTGIIPRPTFSKDRSTEKRYFPSQFHHKKGIRKISPVPSAEATSSESSPSKVTFGEMDYIQTYADDIEFDEPELEETKYYENWIDVALNFGINDVFKEVPPPHLADVEEFSEKAWDEKDDEELTAPLLKKLDKKFEKDSSSSSSASAAVELPIGGGVIRKTAAVELPIGGGVIRKTPVRLRMASVDDPAPLSTSESFGTTSSSVSSAEYKNIAEMLEDLYSTVDKKSKRKKPDTSSNLVRTQSFTDLTAVHVSPTDPQLQPTTPTLAGVYSIELPERDTQQQGTSVSVVEDTKEEEEVENVRSESSGVAEVKREIDKDSQ